MKNDHDFFNDNVPALIVQFFIVLFKVNSIRYTALFYFFYILQKHAGSYFCMVASKSRPPPSLLILMLEIFSMKVFLHIG